MLRTVSLDVLYIAITNISYISVSGRCSSGYSEHAQKLERGGAPYYVGHYDTRVYWAEGPHEVPGSAAWDPGESTCVPRCSALRPGYRGPRNSDPVRQQPSATAAQCYNGPVRRQRPSATTAAHTAALPQPACARGRRRTSAALPPPLYTAAALPPPLCCRSGHRGGEGTRAMTIAGLNDRQKDEEHRGEEGRVGGGHDGVPRWRRTRRTRRRWTPRRRSAMVAVATTVTVATAQDGSPAMRGTGAVSC